MDITTRIAEKEQLAPFLIALKRPQFIQALCVLVRVAAYEKRQQEEKSQEEKELEILLAQKQQIEDHFLLIIRSNSSDVDLAKNYAMLYHNNIKSYISQEILKLCAEIRESVLDTMPDP